MWKLIFWLIEAIFFHFLDTPANGRYFFVYRKRILKRIFYSVWWRRTFCLVETIFSYFNFFLFKWKVSLKLMEINLFGKDFVPVESDFPSSGNCFVLFHVSFPQVELVNETSWNKSSVFFINGRSQYLCRKKQHQFGRDSKITVKQLICFALSQLLFRVTLHFYTLQHYFHCTFCKSAKLIWVHLAYQLFNYVYSNLMSHVMETKAVVEDFDHCRKIW